MGDNRQEKIRYPLEDMEKNRINKVFMRLPEKGIEEDV